MKRVILFVVLFLVGISNSYGVCKDGLTIGQYSWACNLSDPGGWQKGNQSRQYVGPDTIIQTVGQATWFCVNGNHMETAGNSSRYQCADKSGSNDVWLHMDNAVYCSDSPIKNKRATNGYINLKKANGSDSGFSSDNPGATVGGCLYVTCKDSYTPKSGACVSVGSNAKCDVKNTKHPGITCNTSGGTNCLQAGKDGFLYCYAKEYYRKNVIADLENSCQPTVNIVTIGEKPGSYFTCTSSGVWQETKFSRCESGDDFPGGCNGRAGCEDVANSPASSQAQTNATSVTQVWNSVAPETFCMVSRCKSGYTKQGDKCLSQDQVRQAKQQASDKKLCEESFGQWKNKRCQCDASKNLVESNGVCDCEDGYEKNKKEKKCTLIDAESKKNACESSFGKWIKDKCECDISKGLVQQENKTYQCQCTDPENYEFNREVGECRMTDAAQRQANCKKDNRAQWIDDKCVCESGYAWDGSACNFSDDYIRCDGVSGATWDKTEDKCICDSDDKELKDWQCVDTQETIAKGVINTSFPKFESLVSGLEVNKWKSADGTFNVARLASDSIAGAVLGTASGLITSSVVKKNQVKKGFENVRCVVGNQVVAGYGDEFTVGAQ
jgi:hypothetical protein